MVALLVVFVLYWRTATNLPWGPFDVQSLAIDALPFAFAAMGQAIVIIAGGIDLSIGSMMSLINVLSAKYMVDMGFGKALLFSLVLVALGAAIGAVTGGGIVLKIGRAAWRGRRGDVGGGGGVKKK